MIARQKAGRSSGRREVIRLPSTTTSASTQLAPAATRSSLIEKNDVAFRPLRIPADTSIQPEGDVVFLEDRKSTRLNSSHTVISYAVFCLKKKKNTQKQKKRQTGNNK